MKTRFALSLCLVALVSLMTNTAIAQDLPSVDEIVTKHMEATGGEEKYNSLKSMIVEGEMEVPEVGVTGSLLTKQLAPNLITMKIDIAGVGTEASGYDGETAWSTSAITGPQIVEGERRNQFLAQADLRPFADLEKKYDKVECTGIESHGDEDCYVVQVTKGDDDPIFHYFSVESGLHTGTKQNADTPQGKMEIITTVSDYKDVDGLKISHKASSAISIGFTQIITLTSVKLNEDIDKSEFDLPEEIKEIK